MHYSGQVLSKIQKRVMTCAQDTFTVCLYKRPNVPHSQGSQREHGAAMVFLKGETPITGRTGAPAVGWEAVPSMAKTRRRAAPGKAEK